MADSTAGWRKVRAVLTSDRILHIFDAEEEDGGGDVRRSSLTGRGDPGGGGASGAAHGAPALPLRSINCRRASFGVDAVQGGAAAAAALASAHGGHAAIRRSFAGPPPGRLSDDDGDEDGDGDSGGSPAARCFEISVNTSSLLRKFNVFGGGDGMDHFVFLATDRRSLEVRDPLSRRAPLQPPPVRGGISSCPRTGGGLLFTRLVCHCAPCLSRSRRGWPF